MHFDAFPPAFTVGFLPLHAHEIALCRRRFIVRVRGIVKRDLHTSDVPPFVVRSFRIIRRNVPKPPPPPNTHVTRRAAGTGTSARVCRNVPIERHKLLSSGNRLQTVSLPRRGRRPAGLSAADGRSPPPRRPTRISRPAGRPFANRLFAFATALLRYRRPLCDARFDRTPPGRTSDVDSPQANTIPGNRVLLSCYLIW